MKSLQVLNSNMLPDNILAKVNNIPESNSAKVDHVANIIQLITVESKRLKSEELILSSKRKQLDALIQQAEDVLKDEMTSEGVCELVGEMIKYTVSPSPHKLIIDDESLIPRNFKQDVIVTEIRKDAIKDELKMGNLIPGCRLEQGNTLRISANKG